MSARSIIVGFIQAIEGEDDESNRANWPDLFEVYDRARAYVQVPVNEVSAADVPRCAGCGVFLSATRVEMKIDRCSNCDGKPRRRRR
jgi:hypothetical protein